MSNTVFFYVILIISVTLLSRDAYKVIKSKTLKLFTVFSIMYVIIHGLLLCYFLYYADTDPSEMFFLRKNIDNLLLWASLSLILLLVIRIIYYWPRRKKRIVLEQLYINIGRAQILAIILLIIGAISFFLWVYAYGGIFNLILMADVVRAGMSPVHNSLAFMLHPARVLLFDSLLFIILYRQGKKKFLNAILFVCSFTLSILLLLGTDGRFMTAMFFVMILFCSIDIFGRNKINKKKVIVLTSIAMMALFIIYWMDSVTEEIRTGGVSDYISPTPFLITEFKYIFNSGVTSLLWRERHPDDWLIFNDFLSGLFAWFPTSVKPVDIETIWHLNTFLQHGSGSLGETPCEMTSTSIYDFGIWGVIPFGLFWGLIFRYVDSNIYNRQSIFHKTVYCYLSYMVIRLSAYCQLYDVMFGLFPVFMAWVFWSFLNLKNKYNINSIKNG